MIINDDDRKSLVKRKRKFTPVNFFMTILRLVSSDSHDGTQIILNKLFGSNLQEKEPPSRSALSQYRNTISYMFFKNIYEQVLKSVKEQLPKWCGLTFIGIDGDVYSLPRSTKLLENGFCGQAINEKEESHSLKMYTVSATCLISGAPIDFRYSAKPNEIALALGIIANSKKQTVFVYDRLYLCSDLISAHCSAGNYFVARLRAGGTFREVADFMAGDENSW